MHGLYFHAFQSFVRDTRGRAAWSAIAHRGGQGHMSFEPMLNYPPRIATSLLRAASRYLDRPETMLLEDLGTYIVSHPSKAPIRRLLRFGGETFHDFLLTLDDLADWIELAVPRLDTPKLELRELSRGRYNIHIHAQLPGAGSFVLGALRAVADDYGALVVLEPLIWEGAGEIVSLDIKSDEFADPKAFSLQETAP